MTMSASDASGEQPEIQLRRLARWACAVRFEDLPADVVKRVNRIFREEPEVAGIGIPHGTALEEPASFPY